ncbi:MAG: hypothetical protein J7497_16720, partial [Chitinophagaceae bacterium]|nr:hypothetical protein [Chitinophagaceae bacterium]
ARQIKHELLPAETDLLKDMNMFQLEGRYPDHLNQLFKIYKQKQTYIKFAAVDQLRKCLLKNVL